MPDHPLIPIPGSVKIMPNPMIIDVKQMARAYCIAVHFYPMHTGKNPETCPLWDQHVDQMQEVINEYEQQVNHAAD